MSKLTLWRRPSMGMGDMDMAADMVVDMGDMDMADMVDMDMVVMVDMVPLVMVVMSKLTRSRRPSMGMGEVDMAEEDMAEEDMAEEDMAEEDMVEEDMVDIIPLQDTVVLAKQKPTKIRQILGRPMLSLCMWVSK
jgi:hypothetical protein